VEAAGTAVCLVMKAVLLSGRWAGRPVIAAAARLSCRTGRIRGALRPLTPSRGGGRSGGWPECRALVSSGYGIVCK
jgi:hypothetical protein